MPNCLAPGAELSRPKCRSVLARFWRGTLVNASAYRRIGVSAVYADTTYRRIRPAIRWPMFLGDCLWNGSPYAIGPLSVCPVCDDVGVFWPNGLTDQDETWHAGRPRPWPHCVRWGPSSPSPWSQHLFTNHQSWNTYAKALAWSDNWSHPVKCQIGTGTEG